ncbi:hypothetical protein [Acetobacter papayae]
MSCSRLLLQPIALCGRGRACILRPPSYLGNWPPYQDFLRPIARLPP